VHDNISCYIFIENLKDIPLFRWEKFSIVLCSYDIKIENSETYNFFIFSFSWLMRNMGGFFIRRKLGDITPQNELYRAVMDEVSCMYMQPVKLPISFYNLQYFFLVHC
jgi:hypothetical protein